MELGASEQHFSTVVILGMENVVLRSRQRESHHGLLSVMQMGQNQEARVILGLEMLSIPLCFLSLCLL